MEKNSTINFSDILSIQKGKEENEFKYIFKNSKCYEEIINKDTRFVDPSFDSVFKIIFMDT